MISEVVMPQMGADMKEGTVLRWLKSEGEHVERGEIIAEIETDKANIEIEAFDSGVFRKVLVPEGETIPVGTIIAVIGAPEDDISPYLSGERRTTAAGAVAPQGQAPQPAPQPSPEAAPAPPPRAAVRAAGPPAQAEAAPLAGPAEAAGRVRASPVARRLAQELGVDLATVRGTGPDGRIVRRDVEEAARRGAAPAPAPAQAPAPPPQAEAPAAARPAVALPAAGAVSDVPLTRMRQTIARRMAQSKREAPHYYLTVDADMTEALRMRSQVNEALGETGRVSINDLIVLAVTRALQAHPKFNSWWVEDHLQVHGRINIGIAIALDDGLIAPAVLDCQAKPLSQIAREARDLAQRARSGGALSPEEYTAATFTITNLGAFGIDALIGIINPPQTAILGVGRVEDRAVVRGGEVVARSMMTLALSADHRATDGAEGARFLQTLKDMLEKPALMFL
jgi:pyruvate dehydrogenase E2 component (dihydrolipoamide acetyltransferase)